MHGIASKKHRVSELLIHTGQRDHKQYLKSTQKSQIHTSSLIFQFHKPLCIHTKRAFLSVSTRSTLLATLARLKIIMDFRAIFVILVVLQSGQSSTSEKVSDEMNAMNEKFEIMNEKFEKLNEEIHALKEKVWQLENVDENEKDVEAHLYLKMNEMNQETNTLKEKVRKLENVDENEKDVEQRLNHLEELSKLTKARTCEELSKYGIQTSGRYTLDPDGDLVGLRPITVYCDFERNVTEILHDSEFTVKIEKCSDGPGCFKYDLTYFASMPQIQAIMDLSESCTQSIDFGCFLAPLEFEGNQLGWWSDKYGNPNYYFNGDYSSDASDHTCACGKLWIRYF